MTCKLCRPRFGPLRGKPPDLRSLHTTYCIKNLFSRNRAFQFCSFANAIFFHANYPTRSPLQRTGFSFVGSRLSCVSQESTSLDDLEVWPDSNTDGKYPSNSRRSSENHLIYIRDLHSADERCGAEQSGDWIIVRFRERKGGAQPLSHHLSSHDLPPASTDVTAKSLAAKIESHR